MTLIDSLAAIVRWVTRESLYERLYPATVQSVNADGTMDVLPIDGEISGRGITRVRARPGAPGVAVEGAIGAACLVGFEAADPRRPYIAAWSSDRLGKITFDGGTRPVARLGDTVDVLIGSISGYMVGTLTPPAGPPVPFTPIAPLPVTTGTVTFAGQSPGAVITTANPKVLG